MIIITRITAVKRTHGCNSLLLGSGRARAQWQHGEGGGFGGQLPWHRIEGERGGVWGWDPSYGGYFGMDPPLFSGFGCGKLAASSLPSQGRDRGLGRELKRGGRNGGWGGGCGAAPVLISSRSISFCRIYFLFSCPFLLSLSLPHRLELPLNKSRPQTPL